MNYEITIEKVDHTEMCLKGNRQQSLSNDKLKQLLEKFDFIGIQDWSEEEQQKVKNLTIEYGFLFALDNLDLGRPK